MRLQTRAGFVAALLVFAAAPAVAEIAGAVRDLTIVGQHFTTHISGPVRSAGVKDATKGRYLVLKLTGSVTESTTMFGMDFVLVYQHSDGREDRANCDGIAECESTAPGEYGLFRIGDYASATISPEKRGFGLAFYVEPDVRSVELHRVGCREVIRHTVGAERRTSVFLTTNRTDGLLQKANAELEAGGYQVTDCSTGLNDEEKGVTIQYGEKAETAAREISQRLMLKLGVAPLVKKMEGTICSEVDILVWLGE